MELVELECPACKQEYILGENKECPNCGWDIIVYSLAIPSRTPEALEQIELASLARLNWARAMWVRLKLQEVEILIYQSLMQRWQQEIAALQTQLTEVPIHLSSDVGVDYTKLRNLLLYSRWQAADEETAR